MSTSLNQTPSGERVHISIFGRRNSGKSSLINALTNQRLAIVSDVAGTTTDLVSKSMEILPIGPVIVTDTAGIDDTGDLGRMRVEKTMRVHAQPARDEVSAAGRRRSGNSDDELRSASCEGARNSRTRAGTVPDCSTGN